MEPVGPHLRISLAAFRANYRYLRDQLRPSGSVECAAVVKADGYGLGAIPLSRALLQEGCRTFFVAHLQEAIALRQSLPEANIYVFHGLHHGDEVPLFLRDRLSPVLGSPEQLQAWVAGIRGQTAVPTAALHIDTGMRRMGFYGERLDWARAHAELLQQAKIDTVMSHLACADEPEHPLNTEQLRAFQSVSDILPQARRSFANSAGILLGEEYHFQLARPGVALYGVNPTGAEINPMRCVATLTAPILQLHQLDTDHSIGYGATCKRKAGTLLATVELGYADGYFRYLSNRGEAFIGGMRVPIVGRVTMDLIMLDVSAVPASLLQHGARVEFIGPHITVNEVAEKAQTIGYEVFTNLGNRITREYVED
jgi:alanine racemase